MLAEFALSISLAVGPKPPSTDDGIRTHHRQQAAVWSVAVSMAEDTADCLQTATRISEFHTTENNPLTPRFIKTQFYHHNPGGCITGWALVNAGWYLATHRMDSFVQVPFPIAQGINLASQAH
jgi:hypothetical protein